MSQELLLFWVSPYPPHPQLKGEEFIVQPIPPSRSCWEGSSNGIVSLPEPQAWACCPLETGGSSPVGLVGDSQMCPALPPAREG